MNTLYPAQFERIETIISESKTGDEMCLTDSKGATKDILQYLHDEGMLKAKVIPLVIDYAKCMVI